MVENENAENVQEFEKIITSNKKSSLVSAPSRCNSIWKQSEKSANKVVVNIKEKLNLSLIYFLCLLWLTFWVHHSRVSNVIDKISDKSIWKFQKVSASVYILIPYTNIFLILSLWASDKYEKLQFLKVIVWTSIEVSTEFTP